MSGRGKPPPPLPTTHPTSGSWLLTRRYTLRVAYVDNLAIGYDTLLMPAASRYSRNNGLDKPPLLLPSPPPLLRLPVHPHPPQAIHPASLSTMVTLSVHSICRRCSAATRVNPQSTPRSFSKSSSRRFNGLPWARIPSTSLAPSFPRSCSDLQILGAEIPSDHRGVLELAMGGQGVSEADARLAKDRGPHLAICHLGNEIAPEGPGDVRRRVEV